MSLTDTDRADLQALAASGEPVPAYRRGVLRAKRRTVTDPADRQLLDRLLGDGIAAPQPAVTRPDERDHR